ncbi:retrovirus-related pol polyprotein from transposon TNT 1-94 [Tanacetum coccineum]|uniref:Retrovirus-related pol polyprotein from transposon TNT 1-94 n=1 Tax=Tanacetum coccineum TaxID=301880 RepID=A0ABQ5C538_9ASTR
MDDLVLPEILYYIRGLYFYQVHLGYFLKRKSHAPETIMSFIKRVENQNDIHVKQVRTDNGTEFRNSIIVNFYDERGISQNFASPYTPEQYGVVERRNRTLIEVIRKMLAGSIFSKQYWTEVVTTVCYTQNRSIIVKRHLKTPYEIFRGRLPNISFLYVFGCLIYIHNHKGYVGKFDEKADDDYFLGYSLVSKAFRVFNTRRQQIEELSTSLLMKALNPLGPQDFPSDNATDADITKWPLLEFHRTLTNGVITELLASDHKRQVQFTKTLRLLKGLQTQMVELQRQHRPAEGPSQPDTPGEASSSS